MSIGYLSYFYREISYNEGVILAFNQPTKTPTAKKVIPALGQTQEESGGLDLQIYN